MQQDPVIALAAPMNLTFKNPYSSPDVSFPLLTIIISGLGNLIKGGYDLGQYAHFFHNPQSAIRNCGVSP
jgi:hypothetical protein